MKILSLNETNLAKVLYDYEQKTENAMFLGLCLLWLAYDMNLRKRIKYFLIGIGMLYTILGTFLFGEITTEAIMNDIYNADTELSSQCYAS